MTWTGYLSLGGVELVNEERLRTYFENLWPGGPARKREIEPVAGLHMALGDTPYSDPASDMAPWVDLDDAITEEFLGFRIQEIQGLNDAMDEADVTQSLGNGATIGFSRVASREIRVTGVLHGLSPEGVKVGLSWLRRTLWQQWGERLLVPEQPGVSDLRFFIQKPDIPQQTVNLVSNPDGLELGESLVGTAGSARVFRVPVSTSDNWAYRMLARSTGRSEVQLQPLERARATPGQQWVARARIWRDASVLGARVINLLLRFRDQNGNIITAVGPEDTSVPEGVLYRWTGARYDSTSQMLTPLGMVTNWAINPNGNGAILGLTPFAASAARAVMVGAAGSRNYRFTANTTGRAAVNTSAGVARPGQQWWGRANVALSSAAGGRHLRADLVFFDNRGKQISSIAGPKLDLVPTGSTHRWTGQRFRSTSEEIAGDVRRTNYNRNPTPRKDTWGYEGGGGAQVSLERFTGFGTTHCLRVSVTSEMTPAAGINITSTPPANGTVVYVTFWAMGLTSLVLTGRGFTDLAGTANPVTGIPFTVASATPTKISIPIRITNRNDYLLRIGRRNGVTGSLRLTRIGLLTGSDDYFDGDTGTFEWENPAEAPYTSSIAHRLGDSDLYNLPRNVGFHQNIKGWSSGPNTSVGWSRSTKRLAISASAAIGSGGILTQCDSYPYVYGGQKVATGMLVYNNSGTAIVVATRIVASGGAAFDGANTTVPANGSAWVAYGTATMPRGTSGASVRLVAKGTIASGTSIHVDNVFFGSMPAGGTPVQSQVFDGYTPSTNGAKFVTGVRTLTVTGIAPERTVSARLVISRLNEGPTLTTDAVNVNRIMLAQVDDVDTDVDDDVEPTPTVPNYFDGDYTSTFQQLPTFRIDTDPGAGVADTSQTNAVLAAEAPTGAVSAELAIERTVEGDPTATDVIYIDNLQLSSYDAEDDVPDYTTFTKRDLVFEAERWLQEVGPVAGPTVISEQQFGPDGCNGATASVEFTLVAQRAEHLQDRGDRVRLPLPQVITSGGSGAGSFAKLEDTAGIVKNYMPQFDPNSSIIPSRWATNAVAGTISTAGVRINDATPYILRVTAGSGASAFLWQDTIYSALGSSGGWENAIASVFLGGSVAGKVYTVTVLAFKNTTQVASASVNWTAPSASSGDILQDANRVNIPLPAAAANGAANGFAIRVESDAGFGVAYIGIPQVTLTSAPQAIIYGGLPDDGTYTYDFDGIGYSRRTPTAEVESHTIFPNRAAPPAPRASLAGYDEVGQSVMRTFADIDATVVPQSAVAVPIARVDFERFVSRWVRFRFYPNPLNVPAELIPTGSFEYEWVIDQFFGNVRNAATTAGFMSIVIDGVAQKVWLRAWDGSVIPGDQYVVTSNGTPINWPEFAGIPWVVSVDYPTFRTAGGSPTTESWWRPSLALMIKE